MSIPSRISRRRFVAGLACATVTVPVLSGWSEGLEKCPIAVFSKLFQELNLDFSGSALLAAEAGVDGIDCPVRPGGQILPENVAGQLPEYAAELRKQGLKMLLLTTGILSPESSHAEAILRAARKETVKFYRLGSVNRKRNAQLTRQMFAEVRQQLRDLAAMNKEIGVTALVQNHSPSGESVYLGGDLQEMRDLVLEFSPEQVGVAFDIGHALIVHGDDWETHFEALKSHIKVVYVKDSRRTGGFVRFGDGDIAGSGFFKHLKQINYHAPVSLHVEYDWSEGGKVLNRDSMLATLRHSQAVLRRWLA